MSGNSFDPSERGRFPVGVRTFTVVDAQRDGRTLPVEVWYPAHEAHRGQDLDRASMDVVRVPIPGGPSTRQLAVREARPTAGGTHPLVVFSHGHAGFRCASTFLTTHLASHGFVVVAPDHVNDTMLEVLATPREELGIKTLQSASDRPQDVALLVGAAIAPATALGAFVAPLVDPRRVGVVGHSFGGFTALVSANLDDRIRACVPIAPPGVLARERDPLKVGDSYRGLPIGARDVPTLVLAADRDSLCLLEGIERLYERIRAPRALAVLTPADHFHFADAARAAHQLFERFLSSGATGHRPIALPSFDELLDEETALTIVRGLVTAFLAGALADGANATDATRACAALAGRFAPRVRWQAHG